MRRVRIRGPMLPFVVIAERHGAELGRYVIQAVNEADALTDGPFELGYALKFDPFDESIRFRAVGKFQKKLQSQVSAPA
jgi:hypothetical protein